MADFTVEFSDFPASTMPSLPEGFEDTSWHNDVCPSFTNTEKRLLIFIDYEDPALRELEIPERFSVCELDADGGFISDAPCLLSNDWAEIEKFIALRELAANDGAILCWQVTDRTLFNTALDRGHIRFEGDCFVHPDAIGDSENGWNIPSKVPKK